MRTGLLLFVLSAALTGAGFLIEAVPFFVAYLPFAAVLIALPCRHGTRARAGALIAGHFLWPPLIGGWGLIQIGMQPVAVVAGATAVMVLVCASIAWLGIGLSALLLAALPFFPANPLLITGAILPGAGLWGLTTLPLWLILIEWNDRALTRGLLLVAVLILPRLVEPWIGPPQGVTEPTFEEINISGNVALTELRHWAQVMARVEDGDHIILGENMFRHDDHAAIFWWCQTLRTNGVTAVIGVLGPTGLGEVWQVDAETCPEPQPVYRAALGIPMISGGWWPQETYVARAAGADKPLLEPHWLICFEAFSLWRWVDLDLETSEQGKSRPVVILANDYWTAPFPTTLLRRKVAGQFAALFRVEVFHADSQKAVLIRQIRD